jgi:pyruvate dehydrogenase E1 component beta subunit
MLGQVLRRLRPAAAAEVARGYSAAAKEVRGRFTETYRFI